jgi:hypothetical protein
MKIKKDLPRLNTSDVSRWRSFQTRGRCFGSEWSQYSRDMSRLESCCCGPCGWLGVAAGVGMLIIVLVC